MTISRFLYIVICLRKTSANEVAKETWILIVRFGGFFQPQENSLPEVSKYGHPQFHHFPFHLLQGVLGLIASGFAEMLYPFLSFQSSSKFRTFTLHKEGLNYESCSARVRFRE